MALMVYEIVDHGSEHGQYFQGAGVAFTEFTEIVTGVGDNAREAGEDALEMFWQNVDREKVTVAESEALEAEIKNLDTIVTAHDQCDRDAPSHEMCEIAHRVSIRWRHPEH